MLDCLCGSRLIMKGLKQWIKGRRQDTVTTVEVGAAHFEAEGGVHKTRNSGSLSKTDKVEGKIPLRSLQNKVLVAPCILVR